MKSFSIQPYTSYILTTLLFGVLLLATPLTTHGYFFNIETAPTQQFTASELRLDIADTTYAGALGPGLATELLFTDLLATTESSIDSKFDVLVDAVVGDMAFCEALSLSLTVAGVTHSDTNLASFHSPELSIYGTATTSIMLSGDTSGVEHGDTCSFILAIEAWQKTMSKATAGYRDTHTIPVTVTAEMVVEGEASPFSMLGELTITEPLSDEEGAGEMFVSDETNLGTDTVGGELTGGTTNEPVADNEEEVGDMPLVEEDDIESETPASEGAPVYNHPVPPTESDEIPEVTEEDAKEPEPVPTPGSDTGSSPVEPEAEGVISRPEDEVLPDDVSEDNTSSV